MPASLASPATTALHSGPITLYAQLATIFRDRVMTGIWGPGAEIPTLEELVAEFGVARVTVRQAVQMLADEGLLSSQRGRRTFVTFEPSSVAAPLFFSTGQAQDSARDYAIQVLSHQEFDKVPAQFAALGEPAGPYMRIRKVDGMDGAPYTVSDNYVAMSLYRRFPARAEYTVKLSRLVRDNARPPLASGVERTTIGLASYEEAHHLQVPVGSPVAHVTRAFLGAGGQLLYLGVLAYRGDRFSIERDVSYALSFGAERRGAPTDPAPILGAPAVMPMAARSVR